ncbi:MAG: hypothetical protein CM15mV36_0420 [Caudoviricetes sp.]|nr:MAG: hypothetical protein CM15mV36_0420 [Caudoviricetes sp.]
MSDPFGGLNDAFGAEPSELQKHVESVKPTLKKSDTQDVKQDYEVSRAQLHNLVMKGQEAVDGILDVARASDHPRAYEVAGQLIKNVGDVADKLIDLQKKMKELDDESTKVTNNTTNALFVGSTAELQKMLKQQKDLNKKDTK